MGVDWVVFSKDAGWVDPLFSKVSKTESKVHHLRYRLINVLNLPQVNCRCFSGCKPEKKKGLSFSTASNEKENIEKKNYSGFW